MKYRIVNYPYGEYQVEAFVEVKRRTSFVHNFFGGHSVFMDWVPLMHNGNPIPSIGFVHYGYIYPAKTFKSIAEAKAFLEWVKSDKIVQEHSSDEENFSAPVTVVMDGVSIPATANFRVDRVDTPPEDYKGDLMECHLRDDGVLEVTDFIPSDEAKADDLASTVTELKNTDGPLLMPRSQDKAPANRKARGKYDRDELEADIRDGELASSQLLEKYSISAPTLSKVRKEMGYGRTKKEKPAPKKKETPVVVDIDNPAVNLDAEIKLLFVRGFKVQEVSDMYPMVPLDRIIRLKGDAIR